MKLCKPKSARHAPTFWNKTRHRSLMHFLCRPKREDGHKAHRVCICLCPIGGKLATYSPLYLREIQGSKGILQATGVRNMNKYERNLQIPYYTLVKGSNADSTCFWVTEYLFLCKRKAVFFWNLIWSFSKSSTGNNIFSTTVFKHNNCAEYNFVLSLFVYIQGQFAILSTTSPQFIEPIGLQAII